MAEQKQKSAISAQTLLYTALMMTFSLYARVLFDFLVAGVGRQALVYTVWCIFALVVLLCALAARKLTARRRSALVALLAAGLSLAAGFEIFEERTHLLKYGLLGLLLCRDLRLPGAAKNTLTAVGLALWVALADESIQYFTPGRVADLRDIGFDGIGACWGSLLCNILMSSRTAVTAARRRPSFALPR